MKQFLYDICDYLYTSLTEEGSSSFTGDDLAKPHQIAESRAENHMRDSEHSPFIRRKGPKRRDVHWGNTRFAGLEVCPDTDGLFLHLEPL